MGRNEKTRSESFNGRIEILSGNVRRLRLKAGLTQAELVAKAELKRQPTLSEIEKRSDAVNPTLDTLCRLADALDVDLIKLLSPPRKS
jgi:transcriptional regulator with XRE-family HTH domain